jgi:hypothetical protein
MLLLKHLPLGLQWDCEAFYSEEPLHLYWRGNLKQYVSFKFFTLINLGYKKLTMYIY